MMDQAPLYRPVGVTDVSEYEPIRGSYRAKRVDYVLADGTTSFVVIPLDQYNQDTLRQALEDAAAAHADVMSLQGPMVPKTPLWKQKQGKVGP